MSECSVFNGICHIYICKCVSVKHITPKREREKERNREREREREKKREREREKERKRERDREREKERERERMYHYTTEHILEDGEESTFWRMGRRESAQHLCVCERECAREYASLRSICCHE